MSIILTYPVHATLCSSRSDSMDIAENDTYTLYNKWAPVRCRFVSNPGAIYLWYSRKRRNRCCRVSGVETDGAKLGANSRQNKIIIYSIWHVGERKLSRPRISITKIINDTQHHTSRAYYRTISQHFDRCYSW